MTKFTATAITMLVTLAVLTGCESARDRQHIEALGHLLVAPPKHVCPTGAHPPAPVVTVPMHLDDELP